MLVDDDPRLLTLLASELRTTAPEPLAIETFTEGQLALERLRNTDAALVLLDLDMPGLSGLEVLDQIGRLPVAHRVVVMTMHAAATHRAHCEALGARGFVEKDRLLAELPALLARFLPTDASRSGKKA